MIALIFGIAALVVVAAILVNYNKSKKSRPEVVKDVYIASVPSEAPIEEPKLEPAKPAAAKPKATKKAPAKKSASKTKSK